MYVNPALYAHQYQSLLRLSSDPDVNCSRVVMYSHSDYRAYLSTIYYQYISHSSWHHLVSGVPPDPSPYHQRASAHVVLASSQLGLCPVRGSEAISNTATLSALIQYTSSDSSYDVYLLSHPLHTSESRPHPARLSRGRLPLVLHTNYQVRHGDAIEATRAQAPAVPSSTLDSRLSSQLQNQYTIYK